MCTKKVWPGVSVAYPCGWYTAYFSFSIQQILNGVKPVMDLLDKAMAAVFYPLLKALNLNIKLPGIPGLDKLKGVVDSLTSVFDPLAQAYDRLMGEAQALQAKLESLFELAQPFNEICQACVQGRAEQPEMVGLVLEQNQTESDPAVFDAMATFYDRTYLFQGNQFFVSTEGEDTQADGPHPIKTLGHR